MGNGCCWNEGLTAPKVALLMTRGMSLKGWERAGLLSRELAIYRRLQERGVGIAIVSYGGAEELEYTSDLPGVAICCNRWGLPQGMYERLLPWLHHGCLRRADLIKSNQTDGADVALRVARRFGKPLIARCGYMLSEFSIREHGANSAQVQRSDRIEAEVFGASSRIVVTTPEMRDSVADRYPHLSEKVEVIPNYVDVELFSPDRGAAAVGRRLCYVGRLNQEQKNLRALLAAVEGLDVELDIVGDGPLRSEIEAEARRNPRLRLLGRIPNHELPARLRNAALFVLPSFYEGHPKALLEAMACGLPVIGCDVPGVRGLIEHGRNGLLCTTDAASLKQAIETLLCDPERRLRMGAAARETVVARFALEHVVEMELALYRRIAKGSAWAA